MLKLPNPLLTDPSDCINLKEKLIFKVVFEVREAFWKLQHFFVKHRSTLYVCGFSNVMCGDSKTRFMGSVDEFWIRKYHCGEIQFSIFVQ